MVAIEISAGDRPIDFGASGTGRRPGAIPRACSARGSPYLKAIEAGEIPVEDDIEYTSYFGAFTAANEIPDMNTIHMHGVDPTNVWALTSAEIRGRGLDQGRGHGP